MKSIQFLKCAVILLLAIITVMPIEAQYGSRGNQRYRDRYSRANTYGDVVELRLINPGTLEEKMPQGMIERVRLLRIEGPMDSKDFEVIKKICKRSHCYDNHDRKIDNYLDLELERARIMSAGTKGLFGNRGERDVLGDALAYCSHLRSIVLPERLKLIGNGALRGCSDLEEVIMPSTVRALDDDAFSGCYDLEYIMLSENLESIGDECFSGCSKLKSINLPRSLDEIGKKAFKDTGLQHVTLPSGLTKLGAAAFDGTPLTVLDLPASTQIINNDLGTMKKLEEITVENGSRYYTYEDGILYDASGQVLLFCPMARKGSFSVPDDVTEIYRNAFAGSSLSDIGLPSSLSNLGEYAFRKSHITGIVIPDGVAAIPKGAFSECDKLATVELPDRLTTIGESAFENCSSLRSIDLPDGVSILLPRTFKHCKSLVEASFPSALTGIGKEVFEGCALRAIDLPQSLTTLGERAFKSCKGLTKVVVPDACTMLGKEAFRECAALTSIDLGSGVSSIGDNALRETAITTLVIPQSATGLGKKITEKCKSLTRIECHAIVPPKLESVSNNKVELYVPAESVNAYRSAKNWKNFKTILPLE